jgi:hypothetical protein
VSFRISTIPFQALRRLIHSPISLAAMMLMAAGLHAAEKPQQDAGSATMAKLPPTMKACENGNCGLWTFNGPKGEGRWRGGAIGSLTMRVSKDGVVTVERQDATGTMIGLVATYQGTLNGDRIVDGTVKWTYPNHKTASGSWNVDFDRETPEAALARAKLAVVDKDAFEAMRWFSAGAAAGNVESEVDLAQGFANGYGLPRDIYKAAELYRAAARQGSLTAKIGLVRLYPYGVVRADSEEEDAWVATAIPVINKMEREQANAEFASGAGFLGSLFRITKQIDEVCQKRPDRCEEIKRVMIAEDEARREYCSMLANPLYCN